MFRVFMSVDRLCKKTLKLFAWQTNLKSFCASKKKNNKTNFSSLLVMPFFISKTFARLFAAILAFTIMKKVFALLSSCVLAQFFAWNKKLYIHGWKWIEVSGAFSVYSRYCLKLIEKFTWKFRQIFSSQKCYNSKTTLSILINPITFIIIK